jgi:hypothetical protein
VGRNEPSDRSPTAACRGSQPTRAMVGARKRENRDGEVDVEGSLSSTWAWAAEGIDPLCRLAPGLMFFGVLTRTNFCSCGMYNLLVYMYIIQMLLR